MAKRGVDVDVDADEDLIKFTESVDMGFKSRG